MKKLYSNIMDIHIKGEPTVLYEIVTSLDQKIEKLANETSKIKGILFKYIDSNAGKQYEKAMLTVYDLSLALYDFSESMNDLQMQICMFVAKTCQYDLRNNSGCCPRKLTIEKVKVPANVAKVQYKEEEMKQVLNSLKSYANETKQVSSQISVAKSDIGDIWKDSQYNIFSTSTDEFLIKLNEAILVLEDYNQFLARHIQILN